MRHGRVEAEGPSRGPGMTLGSDRDERPAGGGRDRVEPEPCRGAELNRGVVPRRWRPRGAVAARDTLVRLQARWGRGVPRCLRGRDRSRDGFAGLRLAFPRPSSSLCQSHPSDKDRRAVAVRLRPGPRDRSQVVADRDSPRGRSPDGHLSQPCRRHRAWRIRPRSKCPSQARCATSKARARLTRLFTVPV